MIIVVNYGKMLFCTLFGGYYQIIVWSNCVCSDKPESTIGELSDIVGPFLHFCGIFLVKLGKSASQRLLS